MLPSTRFATAERALEARASDHPPHPGDAGGSVAPTRSSLSVRILASLAVVAAIKWGHVLLIPLVLGVLISYALEPIVARLGSWRLPRPVAVPLVLTLVIAGIGGIAYALRGEVDAFLKRLPAAAHTVAQAIEGTTSGTPGTVAKVQEAARELEKAASSATKSRASDGPDGVTAVRIEEPTFKWSDWVRHGSSGALEFMAQLFAVLCLVYYLLIAGDLFKRKVVRMVPTLSNKKITVEILAEIDRQIERFLLARIAISLTVGIVVWLSFSLLGLAEAGVWGVLSAVLFAIPIVGPTVVVVGAAFAAFVQFGSVGMAATIGGVSVAIGALEGNVLTPWLMSQVGEMNAAAVFVSLLFWSWIWGGWGLLLAVPITASARAICERIPDFHGCAELLKK